MPWCTPKPMLDPPICLSGEPMYGAAALGGAEDARSPMFDLGWKTGARKVPWDVQGVKREAFEAAFLPINLTFLVAHPCYYAEKIPLSFVRLEGSDDAQLSLGIRWWS